MAVQRDKVCLQLAESMLDAAGSLQQLQEELDRISLRSGGTDSTPSVRRIRSRQKRHSSRKATKNEKKKMTPGADSKSITVGRSTQQDESFSHDTVSLGDSESCEQPSSLTSSSHFDSAIGSLHSQTDNDSMNSQLFIPPVPQQQAYTHHPRPPQTIGRQYHKTPDSYSPSQHYTTVVEHYTSPQVAMPTLITVDCVQNKKQNPPQYLASRTIDENQQLLQEDKVMVMGTHVQLRQKAKRQTVQQWQLTAEDSKSHFQWLESSNRPSTVSASIGAYIEPAAHTTSEHDTGSGGVCELESEGSGSTVVADEVIEPVVVVDEAWQTQQQNQIQYQHPTIETPQASFPIQGHSQTSSRVNMPPRYHTTSSIGAAMEVGERDRRQPPKRNASILQRLRRRRGSFRQRRHIPVQRSLSDRFVYHLKKKWENNNSQEDFYPISNPSLLRPIGRLLKTYAGRLHIIQLHKPADGRYGVYISQGVDQKIFISRFATAQSEKFYAGLLCPGDEIVSVNKHKIRGRSLDSVYRMLSQLDSVIIAVVPVTAHRNW